MTKEKNINTFLNGEKKAMISLLQELEIITNNIEEISHLYQMLNKDDISQESFTMYKGIISLSVPQWQYLSNKGKVLVLKFLTNIHFLSPDPAQKIQYYQQAITLGVPVWDSLNDDGKETVLACLYNLGVISPDPAQKIQYYQQAITLGVPVWDSLNDGGKTAVLDCLWNLGAISPDPAQKINHWQQAITLGVPVWDSLNDRGKTAVLACLYNLGVISPNPAQKINHWQQAITLGVPVWDSLNDGGKTDVLACLYNLGVISPDPAQKIQYYQQAITLSVPVWDSLNDDGKTAILDCLRNLITINLNQLHKIKYQQQYLFFVLTLQKLSSSTYHAYCSKHQHEIGILLHNLINNTTAHMHHLSAIQYAEYLLAELPITKIDWLFSPNIELFSTLAEALLVNKLTLPNNIIQQFQKKPNDINTLVGSYSRYLIENQQWFHPIVGDFGTLTLALIANHCSDKLLSIYYHHSNFKEGGFFNEEQLKKHKQHFNDSIDWYGIKQILITEQHRNNPKQSIETLFSGYEYYKLTFIADCRNQNLNGHKVFAKQRYIEKWDEGEIPTLVFNALQFIPINTINKIIDFYNKFCVDYCDDDATLKTILSAWLLNNISKPFTENILIYIASNLKNTYDYEHLSKPYNPWHTSDKIEHWSEYLFGLLPIPRNNLTLLNVLRHCQQIQLPQWLKNAQQGEVIYIEKIWRALEIGRFGLNLKFVLPNKKMIKISDEEKKEIQKALIFQMAEIKNNFDDNKTENNGAHSNIIDPYLVLKNLAKSFEKSNVNLQIPSILECQNYLEHGDFIVQIWQDNIAIDQINLLIVSNNHQIITTTNYLLDSNVWQNISINTDPKKIEDINKSIVEFLEELLNILKDINKIIKKIYILPMDKLAILPWQHCWGKIVTKQNNKNYKYKNIVIEIISTICAWINTKQINQSIKESSIFLNKQIIQEMEEYDINPDLPNLEFHSSQLLLKGKLSSINSNPLWLLQNLNNPMYHHIISHAIFDNLKPECSYFQYHKSEESNLFAWKISCSQMAGEVNLAACEALSIGSKDDHLKSNLYFGPMGIGASIHAAGAQVVVGNIWQTNILSSYLFNHYWYTYREKYNTQKSLILAQNTLRELTKKEIIDFLIKQKKEINEPSIKISLNRIINEFEFISKDMDTKPFSHPFFWQGYCVLGFHKPTNTNKRHFAEFLIRNLTRIKSFLLYLFQK